MYKRSSSDDRLLTGSIGVSPLRLHCGRAANYGSIIIPCACYCPVGSSPSFAV